MNSILKVIWISFFYYFNLFRKKPVTPIIYCIKKHNFSTSNKKKVGRWKNNCDRIFRDSKKGRRSIISFKGSRVWRTHKNQIFQDFQNFGQNRLQSRRIKRYALFPNFWNIHWGFLVFSDRCLPENNIKTQWRFQKFGNKA